MKLFVDNLVIFYEQTRSVHPHPSLAGNKKVRRPQRRPVLDPGANHPL